MILAKRCVKAAVLGVFLAVLVAGVSGWGASTAVAQEIGDKIKCEKINADRKVMKKQIEQLNAQIQVADQAWQKAGIKEEEKAKQEQKLKKLKDQHGKMTKKMEALDKEADKAKCK